MKSFSHQFCIHSHSTEIFIYLERLHHRVKNSLVTVGISNFPWRLVGYCHLCLASRCRHPAPGQDLIPLQRLHVFAHSRDLHPAIKLWCQVPFTKSKTIFQIEMYCMQCFLKSKYIKVELSMIKIGELLRKLWSLRSCFLILPPGALTPQGIEGAMKRVVNKHWCTLQWCASRGWFIAHENLTSSSLDHNELNILIIVNLLKITMLCNHIFNLF